MLFQVVKAVLLGDFGGPILPLRILFSPVPISNRCFPVLHAILTDHPAVTGVKVNKAYCIHVRITHFPAIFTHILQGGRREALFFYTL